MMYLAEWLPNFVFSMYISMLSFYYRSSCCNGFLTRSCASVIRQFTTRPVHPVWCLCANLEVHNLKRKTSACNSKLSRTMHRDHDQSRHGSTRRTEPTPSSVRPWRTLRACRGMGAGPKLVECQCKPHSVTKDENLRTVLSGRKRARRRLRRQLAASCMLHMFGEPVGTAT
jgi:hypothetical protein